MCKIALDCVIENFISICFPLYWYLHLQYFTTLPPKGHLTLIRVEWNVMFVSLSFCCHKSRKTCLIGWLLLLRLWKTEFVINVILTNVTASKKYIVTINCLTSCVSDNKFNTSKTPENPRTSGVGTNPKLVFQIMIMFPLWTSMNSWVSPYVSCVKTT